MAFTKIVVAGSTGLIADEFIPLALSSTNPKFDVTILTRRDSQHKPGAHLAGAKVVAVDYSDHAELVRAVSGADAIVSLVSGRGAVATDQKLFRAAREAGVRRIFNSEYTLDVLHPAAVERFTEREWPAGRLTPLDGARAFRASAAEGGPTSFTTLMPAAFIDKWLEGAWGTFDPKHHKVALIDGGDHYFTGCSLPFIARCIVVALQTDEEETKNKRIPIAEVRATMKDVVAAYEETTGLQFQTVPSTIEDLLAARDAALKAGDAATAILMCIVSRAFDGSGAGDLKEGLEYGGAGSLQRRSLREICADAVRKVVG